MDDSLDLPLPETPLPAPATIPASSSSAATPLLPATSSATPTPNPSTPATINSKVYIYLHASTSRSRLQITPSQHLALRQLCTRTVRSLNIKTKSSCAPNVWAEYERVVREAPELAEVRGQLEGEVTEGNLEVREAFLWLLVRCLNSVQGAERGREKRRMEERTGDGQERELGGTGRRRKGRRKKEYYPEGVKSSESPEPDVNTTTMTSTIPVADPPLSYTRRSGALTPGTRFAYTGRGLVPGAGMFDSRIPVPDPSQWNSINIPFAPIKPEHPEVTAERIQTTIGTIKDKETRDKVKNHVIGMTDDQGGDYRKLIGFAMENSFVEAVAKIPNKEKVEVDNALGMVRGFARDIMKYG